MINPKFYQGINLNPIYTEKDLDTLKIDQESGKFPYTRGPYATMYTHRPWTIRQVTPNLKVGISNNF